MIRAFYLLLLLWVCSCSPFSRQRMTKEIKSIEASLQDHTGFMLYDLDKKKVIFDYNAAKYFTPASNTKILTFFASLKILGDSVPALRYVTTGDSLIFWGTGDPSLLYKEVFNNYRVYDFFENTDKQLYFSTTNFHTSSLGSGWAWDDYSDYYSAERSPLPVYGNLFTIKLCNDSPYVRPQFFQKYYSRGEQKERNQFKRDVHSNDFKFHPGKRKTATNEWDIPIRIDKDMIVELLSDTLHRTVYPVSKNLPDTTKTLYSIPTDSLYRVMMQESDNFIAEQLLLICAGVLSDTLQPEISIQYVKDNFLKDLPDEPLWVDGSGLSRYNLFTPRSVVRLWEKIYALVPPDRLFPLLATGGKNGTIKNWYKADSPYIFGKTGSLSNNHNLSGYLVTKSGKTLIFSFMNNNFVTSTNIVKTNMQEILKMIYERY